LAINYSIAPTQNVLAIKYNPEAQQRSLGVLRRGLMPGLIPYCAKDTKIGYKTIIVTDQFKTGQWFIDSKPATFMVSKGFEVSWQVVSQLRGMVLRLIDGSEARAGSD
jgi:hypothetical protein